MTHHDDNDVFAPGAAPVAGRSVATTRQRLDTATGVIVMGSDSSRRWDGQPETAADTRFFDLRGCGYRGWIDQHGHTTPCPICGRHDCAKGLTGHRQ